MKTFSEQVLLKIKQKYGFDLINDIKSAIVILKNEDAREKILINRERKNIFHYKETLRYEIEPSVLPFGLYKLLNELFEIWGWYD